MFLFLSTITFLLNKFKRIKTKNKQPIIQNGSVKKVWQANSACLDFFSCLISLLIDSFEVFGARCTRWVSVLQVAPFTASFTRALSGACIKTCRFSSHTQSRFPKWKPSPRQQLKTICNEPTDGPRDNSWEPSEEKVFSCSPVLGLMCFLHSFSITAFVSRFTGSPSLWP